MLRHGEIGVGATPERIAQMERYFYENPNHICLAGQYMDDWTRHSNALCHIS